MGKMKHFVKYRARCEGSIAENYLLNECLTFCSMYLGTVETRFNRKDRNYADMNDLTCHFFVFTQSIRPWELVRVKI